MATIALMLNGATPSPSSNGSAFGRTRERLRKSLFKAAQSFGPAMMAGITFSDWMGLLLDSGFAVDARCWPRALTISLFSVANSFAAAIDSASHRHSPVEQPKPPLFVLGHWRSGTTHLHNLLACDQRLIAPTLFQVLFPSTFRSTEKYASRLLSMLLAGPRAFDNVRVEFDLPNEDEFALCLLSRCSPYMSLVFPRNRDYYRKFLTLLDASPEELRRWRSALNGFVAKFSHDTGRVPLLKSPPHTCRIRLLLELFPGARFVHVHRNPYDVFQSRYAQVVGRQVRHNLQVYGIASAEDEIVSIYREMHDSFFRERQLIPRGRYHEIPYERLTTDPLGELRAMYDALELGSFDEVERKWCKYVASQAGYCRNRYGELHGTLRERLRREWHHAFDEWGYPV